MKNNDKEFKELVLKNFLVQCVLAVMLGYFLAQATNKLHILPEIHSS